MSNDAVDRRRLQLQIEQRRRQLQGQRPQGGVSTNSDAVADFTSRLGSAFDGAVEGAKFNLGDNMAGVRNVISGALEGDVSDIGGRYAEGRDAERARLAASRDANPTDYTIGNAGGAGATAMMSLPFATGKTALGIAARGGGIGMVEGGLHGAGVADGQDVGKSAAQGAMLGGIAGIAAPAVVGGAGAVKNAVKDPMTGIVDSLLGRANQGKANRAISGAIESSGRSSDDIAARVAAAQGAGQPEYRLMDALGVAGQRQASGITRSGGPSGTELAEFLERRQLGQGERVGSFVDDAFGTRGTTAARTRDGLTTSRDDAADTAYNAARQDAGPVDVRGALSVIDQRIGGMQGSGVAGDGIDGRLSQFRNRLMANTPPEGELSRELSNFDRVLGVKQDVQDAIGAAVRAGRNNEARELGKLSRALDEALEGASEGYRTANDGFREASRVIDSVDTGSQMASRGRAADNVPAFQSMTPDQQSAARVGYGDNLLDRLERVTAPTSNRAKPLQSFKRTEEAEAMTLDPRLYGDRLTRENEMWETQNRALGGSRTADNQADQEALEGLAGGAMGAGRSALNFQFGDAVAKIADALGPIAKGQNEATRELIARALMSNDPAKVMAPVIAQQSRSAAERRMLEALLRQPMREGLTGLSQ